MNLCKIWACRTNVWKKGLVYNSRYLKSRYSSGGLSDSENEQIPKVLAFDLKKQWIKVNDDQKAFLVSVASSLSKQQLVYGLEYLIQSGDDWNEDGFRLNSGMDFVRPSDDEIERRLMEIASKSGDKREIFQKVRMDDVLRFVPFQELNALVKVSTKKKPSLLSKFKTSRNIDSAKNTPELLEEAKRKTGGKVVTRFPPEPNGYLHIGHAKAMHLSFKVSEEYGGMTYLRLDDTNPENESNQFISSIIDMVHWMGYKPTKVTYASDYFDEMYEMAVQLIQKELAYVDFGSKEEIFEQRKDMKDSPYRSSSVQTNLEEFENMKNGVYNPGEAVLRLKIDMNHPLFVMRDFIAYRIKKIPHPRTGNKWCIYPTYDYTHCITDSLEYITYSLCSLEFETRRESYYWLLNALNIYRPWVWEFSRLNITYTMLSKRKLEKLVSGGVVDGWDDPRMPTLEGLRRKGYTPEGIKEFCEKAGVTRNDNRLSLDLLEHCQRQHLIELTKDDHIFAILDPLKVNLRVSEDFEEICHQLPHLPSMPITKTLYIEREDFSPINIQGYFGLYPGGSVKLLNTPYVLKCVKEVNGELDCELIRDTDCTALPKGRIHWLSDQFAKPMEFRLYEPLFSNEEASEINVNSRTILHGFFPSFIEMKKHFQFERVGFFHWDESMQVFHRTLPLKASHGRKEVLQKRKHLNQ